MVLIDEIDVHKFRPPISECNIFFYVLMKDNSKTQMICDKNLNEQMIT